MRNHIQIRRYRKLDRKEVFPFLQKGYSPVDSLTQSCKFLEIRENGI